MFAFKGSLIPVGEDIAEFNLVNDIAWVLIVEKDVSSFVTWHYWLPTQRNLSGSISDPLQPRVHKASWLARAWHIGDCMHIPQVICKYLVNVELGKGISGYRDKATRQVLFWQPTPFVIQLEFFPLVTTNKRVHLQNSSFSLGGCGPLWHRYRICLQVWQSKHETPTGQTCRRARRMDRDIVWWSYTVWATLSFRLSPEVVKDRE